MRLSEANHLLADGVQLAESDEPSMVEERLKSVEELIDSMDTTVEKLKEVDMSGMVEEERAEVSSKLSDAQSCVEMLSTLRDAVVDKREALISWKTTKEDLEEKVPTVLGIANSLIDSYQTAQPYSNATNDVDTAHDFVVSAEQLKQTVTEVCNNLKHSIPDCKPAIETVIGWGDELQKAVDNVNDLAERLAKDFAIQKELVEKEAGISDTLNKISDRAVTLRSSATGDEQTGEVEKLREELSYVGDALNDLQVRENEPIGLVEHSESLRLDALMMQYDNIDRLLNEAKEELVNQLALITVQNKLAREGQKLRGSIEAAQKVEEDTNATVHDLEQAIVDLNEAKVHLDVLQGIHEELVNVPNADDLRLQTMNETAALSEQYDVLCRALGDRCTALKEFNKLADDVSDKLGRFEKDVHEKGPADANADLTVADKLLGDVDVLRKLMERLYELKEELTLLVEPVKVCNDFGDRLSTLNDDVQSWRVQVLDKKQEDEAERNLAMLVNDFEKAVTDAEKSVSKVELSIELLMAIKNLTMPAVLEKCDRVNELILSVKTDRIEQLYNEYDLLRERYNALAKQVEEKLALAKEQSDLTDGIQKKLDEIGHESEQLLNKYVTPQELQVAEEDLERLHVLLEQLPSDELEKVTERQHREQLAKDLENVKGDIKNVLIPLEKEVGKEKDLLRDFREMLTTLTTLGDDVVALDVSEHEPREQLERIAQMAEGLRLLKGKAEKMENRLQVQPEGMVRRAPVADSDLLARVAQLQSALDEKKQYLGDRLKLLSVAPEIINVSEIVQTRIDELQSVPISSTDEQNAALQDLETKKRQLENLLENIPPGTEGDELRERGSGQLSKLNDMLKQLTAAVGEKLAALAAFNATRDEIEAHLSAVGSLAESASLLDEEVTVHGLDDRLHHINVSFILFLVTFSMN